MWSVLFQFVTNYTSYQPIPGKHTYFYSTRNLEFEIEKFGRNRRKTSFCSLIHCNSCPDYPSCPCHREVVYCEVRVGRIRKSRRVERFITTFILFQNLVKISNAVVFIVFDKSYVLLHVTSCLRVQEVFIFFSHLIHTRNICYVRYSLAFCSPKSL